MPAKSALHSADIMRVAHYLNTRRLGRYTRTQFTGLRGLNYWWQIQKAGKKDGLLSKRHIVVALPLPAVRRLELHYATML